MSRKIRLALAGAGAFGQEHLRALSTIADVEIAGIADVNEAAAQQAAERYGVAAWDTDAPALLGRTKPDGLIVATPGHAHVPLATAALEAGIPVLVEKPVGLTAAEARFLAHVESSSAGFVLPGHVLRFSEPHRTVADMVRSGEIGRILSVSSRRYRDDSHAAHYPDVDPVLMTMIHDIDLALWMTGAGAGELLAVRAPAGAQRSQTVMVARGSAGAAWHLATAWTFPGQTVPPDRIEIVGERGGIDFETGAHIRQYGALARSIDLSGAPADDPLRTELSYFVDCIRRGDRPTAVTLDDAVMGLDVAEAVMASLRSGKAVQP